MSLEELQDLSNAIEDELGRRKVEARKQALVQMKELAASIGMTLEEVITYTSAKKTKGEPRFQNPENSSQTWTGRGKRPAWVKEALGKGKALDDLKI
jgi:DNA-binding protein H-NS